MPAHVSLMNTEILNTVFAGATFMVISIAAIAAVVQLRHLRASNQLQALTTLLADWRDPDMQRWYHYVRFGLPVKMSDETYLKQVAMTRDRVAHPELQLCDYFEQLASYTKYGLMAEASLIDSAFSVILNSYIAVRPVVDYLRRTTGDPAIYENFEYLATKCVLWEKANPQGTYPKGFPRFGDVYNEPKE